VDLEQTPNGGVNGKSVPTSMIITRTYKEAIGEVTAQTKEAVATPDSEEDAVAHCAR